MEFASGAFRVVRCSLASEYRASAGVMKTLLAGAREPPERIRVVLADDLPRATRGGGYGVILRQTKRPTSFLSWRTTRQTGQFLHSYYFRFIDDPRVADLVGADDFLSNHCRDSAGT